MPNTLKYKINSKKSLCKSKKEKKCKKIKGCKMAKGPKKTFCRKIKNKKYGKTIKKRGGVSLSQLADSPMAQQFSKELPSVDSLKDGAKTLLIGHAKEKLEKMLKENNINLEKEDLDEIIDEISKLEVNEMKPLLEALIKAFKSGDEKEIIRILIKNKTVQKIGLKIMRKNPDLMKQVMASLTGGKLTEAEKKALTENAFASYKGKTNNLDRILQSHPTNTRSISDMVEETKEHERNAERYRDKYRNLTANSSYIEKQNNTFEEAMKRRNERLNSKGSETHVPFS